MKYIVNESNTCGQASLTDDLRNQVMESMGYAPKKEGASKQITESVTPQAEVEENSDMPTLYEWDNSVFALDDEVFEIEGDLFLKAIELDSETRMGLDESHSDLFINEVRFEEAPFSLGDIYDFGDEIFIKLDEAKKKDKKKDDDDNKFGKKKDDDDNKFGKKKDDDEDEDIKEELSDDEIDAAMNKNAPKDPKQVALRKKLKPASKKASGDAAGAHGDK